MNQKKWGQRTLSLLAAVGVTAGAFPAVAFAEGATPETAPSGDIKILYTNDVHNAYIRDDASSRLGYAAVAGYRDTLEAAGYNVTIADGGDAIQGEAVGALTKGEALVEMMNATGYDIAVPGNHEFDFGMEQFLNLAQNKAEYNYLSCNFTDLRTGELVFDAYEIMEYDNGVKVAYVGITTPETFTKSTPAYFQDENGNYIYGFCEDTTGEKLYAAVQTAIDEATAEGADYVVAVGHVGDEYVTNGWSSTDIIEHTVGLDAFLDGHSHSTIEGEIVNDKEGNPVVRCSTGTKLSAVGVLTIAEDGTVSSELVDGTVLTAEKDNAEVAAKADEIKAQFEELLNQVVATSEVDLVVMDPVTGKRMVRTQETNLGDLVADAFRVQMGADIGFANGGGVRANINKGDVTYGQIIAAQPFGNMACLVEVTGQQILDALEHGARKASTENTVDGYAENGGFQHVSGITFDIDATIPSGVQLDDKGAFVGVEGERRVKNVMVGGEPIDPEKTYTLAGHNYMLKNGGDGFSMFAGAKVLKDEVMVDNEVVINYITETLGGHVGQEYADPYGQGRIRVIVDQKAATATEDGYVTYLRGFETATATIPAQGGEPTPAPTATAKPTVTQAPATPAPATPTPATPVPATPAPTAAVSAEKPADKAPTATVAPAPAQIPQTSDAAPITLLIVLAVLSAAGFAGVMVWRKHNAN